MRFKLITAVCLILMIAACKKHQKDISAAGNGEAGTAPAPCNTCGTVKAIQLIAHNTIITGTLTLCPDTTYILEGKLWIANGGKIMIPAGTVIMGRPNPNPANAAALIVTKGGRIEANGDTTCPVIFTSERDIAGGNPQPGDWGGIIILGKSLINIAGGTGKAPGILSPPSGIDISYGGTIAADNSGFLRFTRIQYGGLSATPGDELNNLTLCGVGCGTELDHVQTYKGANDGFAFHGGTVNARYLFSHTNADDQFSFEWGYRGNLQYLVGVIESGAVTHAPGSNGIESRSYQFAPVANSFETRPVISNLTIAGSTNCVTQTTPLENAVLITNNSNFVIRNSILFNYPTAVHLQTNSPSAVDLIDLCGVNTNASHFFNNIVFGCKNPYVGWLVIPAGQHVTSAGSIGLANANNFNSFFSIILRGLRPNAAPANTGVLYCGLTPSNCAFTFSGTVTAKGGAVDESGKYWLTERWIQK